MPADPEEAPSHTGVAGENSSFPSPSSSTDVPAGLNTDTNASANQGPLPPRLPHFMSNVTIFIFSANPKTKEKNVQYGEPQWDGEVFSLSLHCKKGNVGVGYLICSK
jgi:hypothetical protein